MTVLSKEDKDKLLKLTPDDVTFDFIKSMFMDTYNRKAGKIIPSRIKFSNTFFLEPGEFHNKGRIKTNVGLYVFNMYLLHDFFGFMDYVNDPINKKELGKIEKKISEGLLTDKIKPAQMGKYLNRIQWYTMQVHSMVSGSFTMNSIKPQKSVIAKRDKLLKENRESIDNGDIIVATRIEKELLKDAKQALVNDPGMDLYDSGARGSFGNNFKNISVMKGPVVNPITGKFDIVETNFMEGIRKENIHTMGNSVISAAYPKAVGTAVAGYFSKKIIAAMQAVVLDESGSDCKTKATLTITIHKSQANDYLYRYVKSGEKLIKLTPENIGSYVDKPIKLRSVMYCLGEKVCSKCGGDLNYMLGVTNLGLTASRASSTILNMGMKKFHDSSSTVITLNRNSLTI